MLKSTIACHFFSSTQKIISFCLHSLKYAWVACMQKCYFTLPLLYFHKSELTSTSISIPRHMFLIQIQGTSFASSIIWIIASKRSISSKVTVERKEGTSPVLFSLKLFWWNLDSDLMHWCMFIFVFKKCF